MNDPVPVSRAYWAMVWTLGLVGMVGILSIGAPFLLLAITLAFAAPVRDRPATFWPILLAVVGFVTAYVLLSPLGCSSVIQDSSPPFTTCTNAVGIDYSGWGDFNPSHVPALLAGAAAAVIVATATRATIRRAQSATASRESHPLGK